MGAWVDTGLASCPGVWYVIFPPRCTLLGRTGGGSQGQAACSSCTSHPPPSCSPCRCISARGLWWSWNGPRGVRACALGTQARRRRAAPRRDHPPGVAQERCRQRRRKHRSEERRRGARSSDEGGHAGGGAPSVSCRCGLLPARVALWAKGRGYRTSPRTIRACTPVDSCTRC